MKINERAQVLPIVIASLVVMTIVIFGLVQWIQNDTTWAVKEQKSTSAINLAEAAIDRGTWKLQSSTATWFQAYAGTAIAGYNFDTTYSDIPGGTYRIKFVTSGANNTVSILGEGRDNSSRELRALSVSYKNQTIYSAMMSGGNVSWAKGLGIFWGPIIAQGNIVLQDDVVAAWYYPRKFAKGTVIGTAANPRDTNGLLPPNTDNAEWWSAYNGVPNVPLLDFAAMRSSAAATGTLNVYGCKGTGAAWDLRASCPSGGAHATHFGDSTSYVKNNLNPNVDYIWYWDGDVTLSGEFCGASPCAPTGHSTGLRGTVIVRGNLTIDSPGDFVYTGHVPPNAWQEENKLTQNTFDTGAANEYPADTGFHSSAATHNFGTANFCIPLAGCGEKATVGIRGFTYVGGNLTIISYMDFHGAVWVNGSINASAGSNTTFCGVFYDDTLQVPALNVILLRQSWQEVPPSSTPWL